MIKKSIIILAQDVDFAGTEKIEAALGKLKMAEYISQDIKQLPLIITDAAAMLLQSRGFEVETAENGYYGVIFMDIRMPLMMILKKVRRLA